MISICLRLLGLVLLPLTPALAAWALYAFRNSGRPEDRSYLGNLRELVAECWRLTLTGDALGD